MRPASPVLKAPFTSESTRDDRVTNSGAPVDAWEGFDLMTITSGINPLVASYSGAPYQLRGVDDAAYSRTARSWWATSPADVPLDGMLQAGGIPFIPDSWEEKAAAFGKSAAVVLLALVVVAFGLFILVKS